VQASEAGGREPQPGSGTLRSGRLRPDYQDEGIVLRTYKLGESDKILRLLTREHGKKSAVGKGVRKTLSRFGARLEPFTHTRLHLHRGRTMDVVKQAEILTSFNELRQDLDLFVAASSLAELTDTLATEDEPNPGLFDLLLLGLQLLKEYPERAQLTVAFFEFKVMGQAGFELMVGGCASCGELCDDEVRFSLGLGGFVCSPCSQSGRVEAGRLLKLSPEGADLLVWMSGNRLGELPPARFDPASVEVGILMGKIVEHWMEREFRSHKVRKEIPGVAG
jgi:DNA repair protein RecO (recombination protein O)